MYALLLRANVSTGEEVLGVGMILQGDSVVLPVFCEFVVNNELFPT
jgi:hypothetical protein